MFDIHSTINNTPEYNPVQFDQFLANCPLAGLGAAFVNAGNRYQINPLFLMALAILESGWGRSSFAVNRNNLFGIAAFDSNPGAAYSFSSKQACIDFAASMISNSYLKPKMNLLYELPNGWKWTVGLYWAGEPTIHAVFVHYSSSHDKEATSIATLMNQYLAFAYPMGAVPASIPVNQPVPASNDNGTYTVKSGDSLWGIASRAYGNGNRFPEIAAANAIYPPYVIHAGQVLVIPGLKATAPAPTPTPTSTTNTYQVTSADGAAGLSGIAKKVYGNAGRWPDIAKANGLQPPYIIHVGDTLRIP